MSESSSTSSSSRPVYDATGQVISQVSRSSRTGADSFAQFAREQPLGAALCIFITGYILGKLF